MTTVREASFDLFRAHGISTVFGNPGSTELPMLADWPEDFTYVLGLQEAVVVGMADGYSQASGGPALVNLHTAPGVGNAMGAIFNAQANHSPLVITAGQQVRPAITMQANLTNRDAARVPHPLVKWSPRARARAGRPARARAGDPPRHPAAEGPDLRLDPDGRLGRRDRRRLRPRRDRAPDGRPRGRRSRCGGRARPAPRGGGEPGADRGPRHRRERRLGGGRRARRAPAAAGVRNPGARRREARVPRGPPELPRRPPAGDRSPVGDPGGPRPGARRRRLGLLLLPLHPGPAAARGRRAGRDHVRPRRGRARAMGEAIVADVALTLELLLEQVGAADRDPGEPLGDPGPGPDQDPISGTAAMHALSAVFPDDGIVVLEAPSATLALRNQLRISRPGSYYFSAGGGLGYGLAAAVGVQLAQPDRPVVCVVGEGSVQYAVTAFWSAVAHEAPVTFLVLRNGEYAILKWFAGVEEVEGAPGLDLPGLDTAAIASGYGIGSRRVTGADELRSALETAIASDRPELVEVGVAPGMWLI